MLQAGSAQPDFLGAANDEIFAAFVDGETKTGKGAAGESITEALTDAGFVVYHDVAGDFYRRYVALVRLELGLSEEDALPEGEALKTAAQTVYESQKAFEEDESLGDLQREAISNSVSTLGKLAISQQAGNEWIALSVVRAREAGANVIVLDGRNLRDRMAEQDETIRASVTAVLDLYLTCDPEIAARRTLLARKILSPTDEQVAVERKKVERRRAEDRGRPKNPFVMPTVIEQFIPGQTPVADALQRAWMPHGDAELPASIALDNSQIQKSDMLVAVAELAVAAVQLKLAETVARL